MEVKFYRRLRPAGLTWWAVVLSLVAHSLLLGTFVFIKVSTAEKNVSITSTPNAKISQVRKPVESPLIMPKPKVTSKPRTTPLMAANTASASDKILLARPSPQRSYESSRILTKLARMSGPADSDPVRIVSSSPLAPARVEFFGSASNERKVCFVVDCSGSMQGLFAQVVQKLKTSVCDLQPDQYFYIIFFGDGNLIENGSGRFVRASSASKIKACNLINSIQPAGRTNAMVALKRAMIIQGTQANAGVIYFLTDGFELAPDDIRSFANNVAGMRKQLAPETKINTIGFWTQPKDCQTLKEMAMESGGDFVQVGR